MRGTIWASVLLAASSLAWAQDLPKASLTGPATVATGTMAVIRTEGSVGKNFRWLILPKEAEAWFLPVYLDVGPGVQQRAGILVPASTGVVYITYVATQGDQSDLFTLVVNAGPTPPPPPPPPPPVDVNPYAPDAAYQAIVTPIKACKMPRAEATALAAAYQDLAGQAAAGRFPKCADLRTAVIARYKALGFGGKYATTVGAAADQVFFSALGDDPDKDLSAAGVGPLLTTMAWAAWETGR